MKYQLVIGLFLLMGLQSLQAQESCYVDQPYVDTYLYTQEDFGQSFLPCGTAELYRIDVPVHNLQEGTFEAILSLYEGDGYAGNMLYSNTVTIEDEWGGFLIHTLSSPIWMQAGQTYTYRIEFNGNYGTMWANFANIYPDGQNYWNGTPQPSIDMGFLMHMSVVESECSTWIGGINESWDEPLNWTPAMVPDSLDCVIIPEAWSFNPTIEIKANVKDITILENAHLTLNGNAELNVYHSYIQEGTSDLRGDVRMKQGVTGGEILGSPVFTRLSLEGFYVLTEPVTVKDLLDVENGYLANIGTNLTMLVNDQNTGHVYMPTENIAGPLTFVKSVSGMDGEIVGIPFNDLTCEQLSFSNESAQADAFNPESNTMNSASMWNEIQGETTFSSSDAVRITGAAEAVVVTGQASNATVHLLYIEGGAASKDLRSVGNPFPSIMNISGIARSTGVPAVTYRWNPTTRQYSVQVDDASIHDMPRIMRPLDAVLLHIPEGEEVLLGYQETALRPYELAQAMESPTLGDHHIRLQIESPSGTDEGLIRFKDNATWAWDPAFDGMKIASMDELIPTLGSIGQGGNVLSINSIPTSVHGEHVVLYVNPGVEGEVHISAPMIDGGECFSTLHLEDRKLGYFHNLMTNGVYTTDVLISDDRTRFILHFDRNSSGDHPSTEVDDYNVEVNGSPSPIEGPKPFNGIGNDYNIHVFSGQLNIRPGEGLQEIPIEAEVTVYSVGGKLVFQRKIMQATNRFTYQLNVSTGIYYVELIIGSERYRKKVWVD
jgi:hypothetical protein